MLAGEVCLSCGEHFGFVCKECLEKLPYNKESCCVKCSIPLQNAGDSAICGDCLRNPPAYTRIYSLFTYEGVVKEIIHKAKFNQKSFYFERLFDLAKGELAADISIFSDYNVIIPIPVSKKRLLERGYNQSAIIAKLLSKLIKRPVLLTTLIKVKDTKPQTNFGREERFKNVKDAFSLKNKLNSVKVILVDDIVTTTATVREASKVLKKGGADEVIVFSLTRAKE
ncbi:MAG: ComF family protein [bacterium]